MEYTKKVIVIGDMGVGKTSFVARVTEGRYLNEHKTTIGVDCAVKAVRRPDNVTVRLVLWDIGGQETFRALMPQYARGSSAIIVMADVTSRNTIDGVRTWKQEADKVLVTSPPSILLVNKFDLPKHIHTVQAEDLDKLASDLKFSGWYQTSVKDNVNLHVALEDLAEMSLKGELDSLVDTQDNGAVTLTRTYVEGRRTCCDS